MKKIQFLAAVAALLLTACSTDEPTRLTAKMHQPDSMSNKTITFTVAGDFHVSTQPMSRSMTADGKTMTDLWVLDYQGESLAQTIHQTSEDADFGTPSIELDYGSHTLYFVASRGSGATIDTEAKTITFTKVLDTFWQSLDITVTSTSDINRTVNLSRIVTKLKIIFSDQIPEGAATFNVIPSTWYYSIDYTSGLPTTPTASQPITLNIPSSSIGVTGESINIFGFSGTDEWTTDININCNTADGSILGHAEISNAPFKRNRQTIYSGPLFDNTRSMTITLNDSWEDGYEATW